MPPTRGAEQALALFASSARPQYVCRACRARTLRSIHTTSILAAEERGFFKRIRDGIFGSNKSKDAKAKRDEEAKQKAKQQEGGDTMTDRKGNTYEFAAIVDNTLDPRYIEASTSRGLRHVGGEQWVKRTQDRGEPYIGFVASERKNLSAEQWQNVLRHVAVEAVALRSAGRDVNEISLPRESPSNAGWTRRADLVLDEHTARLTVTFDADDVKQSLLESIPSQPEELASDVEAVAEAADPAVEAVDNTEPAQLVQSSRDESPQDRAAHLASIAANAAPDAQTNDSAWLSMPLHDPQVKLGIIKRIAQLTGHRISDPTISNATSFADLHVALITKEPPKKLAKSPEFQQLMDLAPNVQVHTRRQTRRDKSKAVGRWKLIEDELLARGLLVQNSEGKVVRPRPGVEQ